MTFEQFSKYIFSMHCSITSLVKTSHHHELNLPIYEYIINSSRNSLTNYNFDQKYNEFEFGCILS